MQRASTEDCTINCSTGNLEIQRASTEDCTINYSTGNLEIQRASPEDCIPSTTQQVTRRYIDPAQRTVCH